MAQKTYVRLNRQVGTTDQRVDETCEWELVVPVKKKDGTFSLPPNRPCLFYRHALLKGETVLVNSNGGWNTLLKTDRILEIYQK
jgi:hypothetical protein